MTRGAPISDTVTLHVPFRVLKRGGRKEVQLPDAASVQRSTDTTLLKALARACRWKRMLDSGEFATIAELAKRESITPSYITRVLRLTLLAPDIIEAILDRGQSAELQLNDLLAGFPLDWEGQRRSLPAMAQASEAGAEHSDRNCGDQAKLRLAYIV